MKRNNAAHKQTNE